MPKIPGKVTGYSWHHMIKLVPEDGAEEVLDIMQEFPDTKGPGRTDLEYRDEQETRTDVNKIRRQVYDGFRARVTYRIEILDIEHQRALVKIMNAFADELTAVHLSLDGGFTYREVIMIRAASPRPIRNKIVIGARFDLRMETAELIDELEPMADAW